jgi:hypothetical protein
MYCVGTTRRSSRVPVPSLCLCSLVAVIGFAAVAFPRALACRANVMRRQLRVIG